MAAVIWILAALVWVLFIGIVIRDYFRTQADKAEARRRDAEYRLKH